MVSAEAVLQIIPAISVSLAAVYYALNIKHQRETRQAQLFMGLYETYRSQEFREKHSEIIQQEWADYDDFVEKYGSETNAEAWTRWMSVGAYFNGIGVLHKRGLLDIALVEELLANAVFISWIRMEPIIKGWRERDRRFEGGRSDKYDFFHGFEYLYNELKKREQQQPELKT